MKTNSSIKIKYYLLKILSIYLITLPAMIFAIGWMKWYFAFLLVIGTIIDLFFIARSLSSSNKHIEIRVSTLLIIIAIAVIWVWLSGIGGFWAQSKDYPWRNAIFRDLILRDWPVHYSNPNGYLVYYFGFWLLPAYFGKIAYSIGANEIWAFRIGNIALALWSVILISVLFLLLLFLFNSNKSKKQIFIILSFVFFSGLDALGSIEPLGVNLYHIEWWADYWQYSSFTTCLFWVFNQSIIPWICMALIIQEEDVSNYVHIGIMCLLSGAFPFVGYFVYAVSFGIIKLFKAIKSKRFSDYIIKVFSVQNILCCLIIFPFIGAFLLSNDTINSVFSKRVNNDSNAVVSEYNDSYQVDSVELDTNNVSIDPDFNFSVLAKYFAFVMLEFGIFAILIIRKEYNNPIYYLTIILLLIFPFVKIGSQSDFTMRGSIPVIFMMYVFVVRFLLSEKNVIKQKNSINRLMYIVLIVCLLVGSITPCVEIYRGCRQIVLKGFDNPMEDYIYTLGSDGPYSRNDVDYYLGYFGTNSPEDRIFFKYLSK